MILLLALLMTISSMASTFSWQDLAKLAPAEKTELQQTEIAISKLDRANREAVTGVLMLAAKKPGSASALRDAGKILFMAKLPGDPNWAGSGPAPWAMALHSAGILVLRGLLHQACERRSTVTEKINMALALLQEIPSMPMPFMVMNNGHVDATLDRGTLQKDALNCVDEKNKLELFKKSSRVPFMKEPAGKENLPKS